jgi:hypothetical protein
LKETYPPGYTKELLASNPEEECKQDNTPSPAAVPDRRERKDDASPFHGSCRQIFRKIGKKRIIGLFHIEKHRY